MSSLSKCPAATNLLSSLVAAAWIGLAPMAVRGAEPSEADTATARALAEEGLAALAADRYPEAAELFARAERLRHAPTLLLGLARAQAGMGKVVEARENYKRVMREKLDADASDAFKRAVESARREMVEVEKKIAWVTLTVSGPEDPEVVVDGTAVPDASLGAKRAINPGEHLVRVTARGFAPSERRFTLDAGGETLLAIELTPSSGAGAEAEGDAGSGSAVRTAGFVSLGVGAAGLLLGAITGGLALSQHSELVDNCPNEECPESEQSTIDAYGITAKLSTAGFVVGGVLAATGLVLVLVAPDDQPQEEGAAEVKAVLSPGALSVVASF